MILSRWARSKIARWVLSRRKTSKAFIMNRLDQAARSSEASSRRASAKMAISRQSATSVIRITGSLSWAKVRLDMMKNTRIPSRRWKRHLSTLQHSWPTAKTLTLSLSVDRPQRIAESRSKYQVIIKQSRFLSLLTSTEKSKKTFELLIWWVVSARNQRRRLSSSITGVKEWLTSNHKICLICQANLKVSRTKSSRSKPQNSTLRRSKVIDLYHSEQ